MEMRRPEKWANLRDNEELRFLQVNSIMILDKKIPRYPYAKFKCKACNYLLTDMNHVTKHVEQHKKRENRLVEELVFNTIKYVPFAESWNSTPLSKFLLKIHDEERETESSFKAREELGERIIEDITSSVPNIALQLNGSSLSHFALKNVSNMDFSLQVKESHSVKDALNSIYDTLALKQEESFYLHLAQDFKQKYPQITFTMSENHIPCRILLKNKSSLKTSLLLRDYWDLDARVRILGIVARYWAYSCGITNNVYTVIPSHSIIILLLHYLIHEGVVPCIKEHLSQDEENDYETPREILDNWNSTNYKSTGELWVGFLKYYCVDFNTQEVVVQICSSSCITKADMQWKYKRLSIQDPYCCNKNLLSVVHNTTVFEYIQKCFQYSSLFFGVPQTQKGPLFKIVSDDSTIQIASKIENNGLNDEVSMSEIVTLEQANVLIDSVQMEDMVFEWNVERFNNNSKMPIVCSVCTNEGHTQDSCPDEILPEVNTMGPLPQSYLAEIDQFFHFNMDSLRFSMSQLHERELIIKEMAVFIRKSGYPTAVLTVYGSSDNGFGFKDSDLDLCLTFSDHETSENIDSKNVIEKVAKIIEKMNSICQIRAVTSAKVPIIKFVHQPTSLEGDISFYNCLAFENTKLLRTYSEIDLRVKILGYNVKRFIKSCDFGDASRGSLSSYTCVILALFYLQQLDPPVIPVLQELPDSKNKTPSRMFEGHDVWFNSNPQSILYWKNSHHKNIMSPAELLIGFFDFFGRQFDDDNIVVSIRTHRSVKKLDKMWNTDCLAVEDPFEVNRNLGGRLTRRMHLFIKKCFIKGYERFATPMSKRFYFMDPNKYFFNASNLGVGKVPTDRGCHICGGIWHVVRECPRKMMTKRHKGNKKNHHGEERNNNNTPNSNKKSINEHKRITDRSSNDNWRGSPRHKDVKTSASRVAVAPPSQNINPTHPPRKEKKKSSPVLVISKNELEEKNDAENIDKKAPNKRKRIRNRRSKGMEEKNVIKNLEERRQRKRPEKKKKKIPVFLHDYELESIAFYYEHGPIELLK
uniref:C2H2-type domain-containing protein n=1 Tax=Lepeophtheirus salmonis TaxID=72036 RepID=A0A0K2SYH5_LEPSM